MHLTSFQVFQKFGVINTSASVRNSTKNPFFRIKSTREPSSWCYTLRHDTLSLVIKLSNRPHGCFYVPSNTAGFGLKKLWFNEYEGSYTEGYDDTNDNGREALCKCLQIPGAWGEWYHIFSMLNFPINKIL